MKTVFILGAGASRQAGGPLMNDFIDKAEHFLLSQRAGGEEGEKAMRTVLDAINELQGVHSKSFLELDNIETLFQLRGNGPDNRPAGHLADQENKEASRGNNNCNS